MREDNLESREKRNQSEYQIFDNIPSGVAVYEAIDEGADFLIVDFNSAAEEITGKSKEEVIGQSLLKLFPAFNSSPLLAGLRHVYREAEKLELPIFHTTAGREPGWRQNHIYKLPDGKIVAIFEDVTEKKESEKVLLRNKEILSTILDAVPDILALLDNDYNVIRYNRRGYELFGKTPEEVYGMKCYEVGGRMTVCDFCATTKAYKSKKPESLVFFSEGIGRWLDAKSFPILDEAGEVKYIVEHIRDITEERVIQEQLVLSKQEAEKANIAKSDFLANMSHEIRTPLNGIMGMLQLLQETPLEEDQREYVKVCRKSSDALLQVINDVLDFSKIQNKKIIVEEHPFNLADFMNDVEMMFHPSLINKGLVWHSFLDPGIPKWVVGDYFRLRQVVNNLVGNAIKFTNEGRVGLEIRLEKRDENSIQLLWEVSDTGIGISPDKREHVFQSFAQEDSSISRKFGGSGLGLAISKGIVESMGGIIGLQSEKGKGSRFFFRVPLGVHIREEGEVCQAEDITTNTGGTSRPVHLLIAEDDEVSRLLLQHFAAKRGWTCTLVKNGEEAVRAFQEGSYDMIFMDVQMPQMDGYMATAKIRELEGMLGSRIPIIATTAHALEGDREKCLQAGMDGYLSKPVNSDQFFAEVEKWVKPD